MDLLNYYKKSKKIYFIGIGGISMSGLAMCALEQKKQVFGSDIAINQQILRLEKLGATVYLSHKKSNIGDVDLVVYSSSISIDNEELIYAKSLNIPVLSRSQFLGQILGDFNKVIAVSGCHGKTTTTAMLARVLEKTHYDPTVFIGGEDLVFSNYKGGENRLAITEACEYKKNLLDIKPSVAVILNVDNDHLDSYSGLTDMLDTFRRFSKNCLKIINYDDTLCRELIDNKTLTFGLSEKADYYAKDIKVNQYGGATFTVCSNKVALAIINLRCLGEHNVYNALATYVTAKIFMAKTKTIVNELESFKGVKRRSEYLGEKNGVKFYADYAHHPTEIKATLKAFSKSIGKFYTIFQPHTYSRTRILMSDFIESLKEQDVVVYKTYSARENYDKDGDGKTLCQKLIDSGCNAKYIQTEKDLVDAINEKTKRGDVVLFLGAGDIYDIANDILKTD